MSQNTRHLYEFGPFLLDTAQHVLSRDGVQIPLTPKTYDMLVVLVQNGGRLLSKGELMKALWPDSFVEESNLTQQVSVIRKALGESPGQDRYIVTVPGRGYRFAAEVTKRSVVAEPVENEPPAADEPSANVATQLGAMAPVFDSTPSPRPAERKRSFLIPAVVASAVALIAICYFWIAKSTTRAPVTAKPRSLAVLPFQSLKLDAANDFLGVSLADAVITRLGYVSAITVRPSSAVTNYRNRTIDIQKVAADLHVDTLLTGNFLRDGDDLRITSQLIDVSTQNLLWKGAFDLKYDRLLTVQDSVAGQIIRGLELSLSPQEAEHLKPDRPIDPLAYEYYLRGVDLYSRNEFALAIKMLEKSAEIAPTYALTWAHLGRAHTANASFELVGRSEYTIAQAAYEKAVALQPSQIDAQIYMANLFTDTGRVELAVPLLRDALKINPNHAEAHWELGYAYRFAGMLQESVTECERARQLDPGVKLTSSALNAYLYLGQYDKFLASLPKGDNSAFFLFYRGFAEYHKGNTERAIEDFDRAFELRPSLLQARIGKALRESISNRKQEAANILREAADKISELAVGDPEAVYKIAQAYAVLGDKPSAFRLLEYSIEHGFFCYPYLINDPLTKSLRGDAKFVQLTDVARTRHDAFKSKLLKN